MKTKAMDGHATIITCVSGYSWPSALPARGARFIRLLNYKGTYALDQHQFHQERCLVDGATE